MPPTTPRGGDLNVALPGGFAPLEGQSWLVVDNDGVDAIVGRFANATIVDATHGQLSSGGVTYAIDYAGGTDNDVVLTTVVPEPGTLAAIAGAAALGVDGRREQVGVPSTEGCSTPVESAMFRAGHAGISTWVGDDSPRPTLRVAGREERIMKEETEIRSRPTRRTSIALAAAASAALTSTAIAGTRYVGSAATGDEPNAVAVTPNGEVWIANRAGNSVSRLSGSLAPIGTITSAGLTTPTSIASFPGGNVLVAAAGGGAGIRADGSIVGTTYNLFGPLHDISAAADGFAYWTNGLSASVSRVRGENGVGTAVDGSRNGFVTGSGGVVASSAAGEIGLYGYSNLLRFAAAIPEFSTITGSGVNIAPLAPVSVPGTVTDVAMNGTVGYATAGDSLSRLAYASSTPTSVSVGTGALPQSLDVSSTGRIYVLASGFGQVKVYDADLNLLNTFGNGVGSDVGQMSNDARGIEVTSLGNIYVADRGNDRVVRFFDAAEWTAAGTNSFADLDLGADSLALTAGKRLVATGTLTLGSASTLTVNGGDASVATIAGTGTVRHLDGTFAPTGATVAARYVGGPGAVLTATGALDVGLAARVDGFQTAGELHVGAHAVTLRDANRASLGLLTTLGGGTLAAANGLFVDFDGNVTGTGAIDTPNTLAKATIVNGAAVGDSFASPLTFTGYVKGLGTFENVAFGGTYAPGLSPARTFVANSLMASTGVLEMELGGTSPGDEHDVLDITGAFGADGTLRVLLIDGFVPSPGESFDLFDGSLVGTFDAMQLPTLAAGLTWDTSQLYTTGVLSVSAVPEPAMLAAIVGTAALLLSRRRRR